MSLANVKASMEVVQKARDDTKPEGYAETIFKALQFTRSKKDSEFARNFRPEALRELSGRLGLGVQGLNGFLDLQKALDNFLARHVMPELDAIGRAEKVDLRISFGAEQDRLMALKPALEGFNAVLGGLVMLHREFSQEGPSIGIASNKDL